MTDDQLELVNAYLDGEATPDERALVESDPELLAEVGRLRAVRNALSDVELPSAAARESAIAAALATFEELPATAAAAPAATTRHDDPTAPTNIVPFERRRRMRRLQGLSAAAAAVVIVVGGIAISQRDDGDSTAERDVNATEMAPSGGQLGAGTTNAPAVPSTAPSPTTPEPMLAVVSTTTIGAEAATADVDTEGAADGAFTSVPAADEMALPQATAELSGAVPSLPSAPAPDDTTARLEVLRDEDDLDDFAATLKDAPLAADDAAMQCEDATLKADAIYDDDDGDQHPIVVVMIEAEGEQLGALSLDTCEIVLPVD